MRYLPTNLNSGPILMLAFQLIPKEILVVGHRQSLQHSPLALNQLIDLIPYSFAMETGDLFCVCGEKQNEINEIYIVCK